MKLCTPQEEQLNEALRAAGIKVRYEPKMFRSKVKPFTGFRPDFYLPELDLYVEVGIRERKNSKIKMMKKHYPNVNLLIIDNYEIGFYTSIHSASLATLLTESAKLTSRVSKQRIKELRAIAAGFDLLN